jgi:electron transport complex protein RnfB
MAEKTDVYNELANMYEQEDPVGIGGPVTPSFLKVLSLQFTKAEAGLALQIRFGGGTLGEISKKSGIKNEKLQKMFYKMADKGTLFYDPDDDDPTYSIVATAAPGITETGMWSGIRFPYSIELGKAIHQYLKEWAEAKLCTLGAPFAPVWASVNTLPDDAKPSENLIEALREEGHWSISPCPCRTSHWIADPGNHCEHMLESCLNTGPLSRWTVKHGMARALTFDEVIEFLDKCNKDGLVHTLNIQHCVCNCCADCCGIFHGQNIGHKVFVPSPFMAQVDDEACNACEICSKRCPVNAIEIGESASVNQEDCLGCGVCVPTCKTEAMRLVRR